MTVFQVLNDKIHINGKTTQQEANKQQTLNHQHFQIMMLMYQEKKIKKISIFFLNIDNFFK